MGHGVGPGVGSGEGNNTNSSTIAAINTHRNSLTDLEYYYQKFMLFPADFKMGIATSRDAKTDDSELS